MKNEETAGGQPNTMEWQGFRIRDEQKRFLQAFKARGGNPSQYVRLALDRAIEEDRKKGFSLAVNPPSQGEEEAA